MIVQIPDIAIQQSKVSEKELLLEIAIMLFEKEILSLKAASKFAQIHWFEFQKIVASRKIPIIRYTTKDLDEELENLKKIIL